MRDFVIRLASMKLASMGFTVEFITSYTWTSMYQFRKEEKMTLKEIKDMLKSVNLKEKNNRDRWGFSIFAYENDEVYKGSPLYYRFHVLPKNPDNEEEVLEMTVRIFIPKDMDDKTFRQTIKMLGLPVKNVSQF